MKTPSKIGRYQIETEVGRGSMGIVYQARDPRIDRPVALKVVDFSSRWLEEGSASAAEEFQERFIRESKIAGKLSHPGIVVIYDAGEEAEFCYIAMEFVPGPSLKRLLREKHPFSLDQVLLVAQKTASALDYAHTQGVVHRDVKPGNILISPKSQSPSPKPRNDDSGMMASDFGLGFEIKLVDFGIARFEGSDLTREGLVIGSPSYMSPEQIQGRRVDGRSDQFSLGIVIYELITGQKPYPGDDIKAIGLNILNEDPVPASRIRPEIPALWDEILLRALAKDPNDRYPRLNEFAQALAAQVYLAPPSGGTSRLKDQELEPRNSDPGTRISGPESSPSWAESSIVDSIIKSKTYEARGRVRPGRERGEGSGRIWIWYLLILLLVGGIIFFLVKW
ncbi:MAG: serine/threonine-protein kinase [Proteobacteria bacterium]|nr:serine/threonine-protein kinase [Pseudomonadota bacterium]